MSNPLLKLRSFLTNSLLFALVTLAACNAGAIRSELPSPSSAQEKPAGFQWTGTWQLSDPSSTQKATFVLTPEGKLYVLPENTGNPPVAYEIPVTKLSDSTKLPPNTQIFSMEQAVQGQAIRARQSEGKQYTASMNRAQQAYHLEYNKFATTIEQLQIGIKPETENYRYRIIPQGNSTQRVMITAQAKRPDIRSYTGAVFVVKSEGGDVTRAVVCETDQPSTTPPAIPEPPKTSNGDIQCPAGSHQP
jgi:type II secretory pathway pseudopilin PulG